MRKTSSFLVLAACVLLGCDGDPGETAGAEAETETGMMLPDVGEPSNLADAEDGTCHVPGEVLPDGYLRASCAGGSGALPRADDPEAFCQPPEGPRPFGELFIGPVGTGLDVQFCGGGEGSPWERDGDAVQFGIDYEHVLVIARQEPGDRRELYFVKLTTGESSFSFSCTPSGSISNNEFSSVDPIELGRTLCGPISVVAAPPGESPRLEVDTTEGPVIVEMIATGS